MIMSSAISGPAETVQRDPLIQVNLVCLSGRDPRRLRAVENSPAHLLASKLV